MPLPDREPTGRLFDLLLAGIAIYAWPGSAVWTVGLIVGVNLITSGSAVAMMAVA